MKADVTTRGAIEIRTYQRSYQVIRLVACPLCGHEFEDNEPRWRHFLDDHDPEDAGLTPLNNTTDDDPELVTDGGTDAPELTDAVDRAQDAHHEILGLTAKAAAGDHDGVTEHVRRITAAVQDVEEIVETHQEVTRHD